MYVLLGEVSVQVLCLFFNWVACVLRVESCDFLIYFGDQTLVWGIIGKYVLPYSWFSFQFNAVFFSHTEVFYWMRSHLFILSFMSPTLGDISVKILLHRIPEIFLPLFSSRTFMVSWLIFKCFIHLDFIFVYGINWWLSFIFFACCCPDIPTSFVEEAIFTPI